MSLTVSLTGEQFNALILPYSSESFIYQPKGPIDVSIL
jgi:hypothetical protein